MGETVLRKRALAPRTASFPFMSSEPTLSSPTVGSTSPRTVRAKTSPIRANWTRFSSSHSTLAPRSSITLSPRRVGKNDAIAGRSIPGSVLSTNLAIAVGASVRDRIDRQPHARLPARPQRHRRPCIVGNRLVGVVHSHGAGETRDLRQQRRDLLLCPEQQETDLGMSLQGDVRPAHHHAGSAV